MARNRRHWCATTCSAGSVSSARSNTPATPSAAQLEPLDLAPPGPGQLASELDPARVLIGGDLVLHEGLELIRELVGRPPGLLQDDERLRLDEPIGILLTDHRRLEHGGGAHERRLDLYRRDPDPS